MQSEKHRRTAEQLAEANRHIQQAEEAVRRSDRLAALGQLSAGLAHELRNPLGTIKASAEMLQRNAQPRKTKWRAKWRASSPPKWTAPTPWSPASCSSPARCNCAAIRPTWRRLLDRAIAQVEREAPGIAIYKNYAPEIPPFPFDAELMERVFYNLILNAAQATPRGRRGHA